VYVTLIRQGGHNQGKTWKPGILREFEKTQGIRENSGNLEQTQGKFRNFAREN